MQGGGYYRDRYIIYGIDANELLEIMVPGWMEGGVACPVGEWSRAGEKAGVSGVRGDSLRNRSPNE